MVFQSYALYPHMTVRENIEFPLRVAQGRRRPSATQLVARRRRRRSGSTSCSTASRRSSRAASASGSRSRGRSCADPQAFLMDEPLSNLDAKLRVQTRAELIELQRRLEATVVYVTHDQVEAMTMGHRIAIMNDGVLQQVGAAAGGLRPAGEPVRGPVHRHPADEHGRGRRSCAGDGAARSASSAIASSRCPPHAAAVARRRVDEVVLGVRPEHLRLGADGLLAGDGDRGRVARPRAPRRLPPRRRPDGHRAPAERRCPRRARARRSASPPTRRTSTSSTPRPGAGSTHDHGRPIAADDAVRRSSSTRRQSDRARRRDAEGRGLALRAAAARRCVDLRRLHLLPVRQELLPRASTARRRSPGCPSTYVGLRPVRRRARRRRTSSTASGPRSCSRCSPCRSASRSGSASRCSRTRSSRASAIYRTIFSSTVATSVAVAVGDLLHAVQPAGRAAAAGSGISPTPPILENPSLGAPRGRGRRRSGRTSGSAFILMSPGSRRSPTSCIEAAAVDGAGRVVALLAA